MATSTQGLSGVQRQKINHLFDIIDVNYSGTVDESDFRNLLLSLTNARHLLTKPHQHSNLEHALMSIWEQLRRMGDTSFDGRIDREEWLRFFSHALSDEVFYAGLLRPLEKALIDLIDTNGDGRISHTDYRDIVLAIHPNLPEITVLFQKIDLNRDGYITSDEAHKALIEFFLSSDANSPGNWFFGEYRKG